MKTPHQESITIVERLWKEKLTLPEFLAKVCERSNLRSIAKNLLRVKYREHEATDLGTDERSMLEELVKMQNTIVTMKHVFADTITKT